MATLDSCPKCGDNHIFPCRDKLGWFKCQECGIVWKPNIKPGVRVLTWRQTEISFLAKLFKLSQRQIYRLWKGVGPIEVSMIADLDEKGVITSFHNILECYISYHPQAGLRKLPLVPGTNDVRIDKPFRDLKLNRRRPYLLVKIPFEDSQEEYFISCCLTRDTAYFFW